MRIKYSFILSILFVLYATICVKGCINPSSSEDVCLYGSNKLGNSEAGSCLIANDDPFNANPSGSGGKAACTELARIDGEDCIELYAKFICSRDCGNCVGTLTSAQKVCKSLCDDVQEKCPKSVEGDCFDSISFACADNNDDCTDWEVDKSKLPEPIGDSGNGGGNDGGNDGGSDSSSATKLNPVLATLAFVGIVYLIASSGDL
jgi:hypothetical protein